MLCVCLYVGVFVFCFKQQVAPFNIPSTQGPKKAKHGHQSRLREKQKQSNGGVVANRSGETQPSPVRSR